MVKSRKLPLAITLSDFRSGRGKCFTCARKAIFSSTIRNQGLITKMNTLAEHLHLKGALAGSLDCINCRVARSREELEKAYNLVYKEYYKRAYTNEIPSRLRFSIYNALPQTTTFVAVTDSGEIVSTATIIPDSPLGLPMDKIYAEELNQLREQNKKLCEISMLATDTNLFKNAPLSLPLRKLFSLFIFFKLLLDYVKGVLRLDTMCITIHPKYKKTFNLILFNDLGIVKSYSDVNGAPAVGQYIDVHSVKDGFSRPGNENLYKIFVLNTTDPVKFTKKMMLSLQDLRYFFLEKSDIFKTAHPAHIEYIENCYFAYNGSKIAKRFTSL